MYSSYSTSNFILCGLDFALKAVRWLYFEVQAITSVQVSFYSYLLKKKGKTHCYVTKIIES